ncbi:unnamed protein product [Ceutorhynchus assimilis]|uniref:Uncharacterized protein n=1 Tax=Ceutorhynchus assimilis TaxID=467358 RepID=A0A9N9MNN5_9CUCU|nr:unnamed protein product [Ceutorhynchus assimilis]
MLKVTRDRSFLLDKLLEKEKVEHSTSESDPTESSSEEEPVPPQAKRRKLIKKPPKKKADGHMTPEEVERHLQAQSFLDLVPERPPLTVPTEMFSHEPSSLDSESNLETSPLQEEIINIL